jgi:plastocyanin
MMSLRSPKPALLPALFAVVVSVVVLLSACGDDEDTADGDGGSTDTTATTASSGTGGSDLATATAEMDEGDVVDKTAEAAVIVNARDNYFDPKYVEVKKGTTITFLNDGRNVHNVLPVEENAFTPIETGAFDPGAEGQITFSEVGDFPYYCSLHGSQTKGMIGGVKVVE